MFKLTFSVLLFYVFMPQSGVAQPSVSPTQKTGKIFRDCADCPEMVVLPAGHFLMGSPNNEPGRFDIEGPQREVQIAEFAVGKFDITRGEWNLFVKATNRETRGGCSWSGLPLDSGMKPWNPNPAASWNHLGFAQDDDHPVVCITWFDAVDYTRWLSKKTGKKYRLLSESEWEYAARAGTQTPFYWGSTASHDNGNYGRDSCCSGFVSGRDQWMYTSPAGSFPPNAFGLYDMSGNVLQYVEDCLSSYEHGESSNGKAVLRDTILNMTGMLSRFNGRQSCSFRMVRGGDWGDPPSMLRSAFRNMAPGPGSTLANYSSGGVGFRVARGL